MTPILKTSGHNWSVMSLSDVAKKVPAAAALHTLPTCNCRPGFPTPNQEKNSMVVLSSKFDRNRLADFPLQAKLNVEELTRLWKAEGVQFGLNAQRDPVVINLDKNPAKACLLDGSEFKDALMLRWHAMFNQTILTEAELGFLVSLFSAECRRTEGMLPDCEIRGIENTPIVRSLCEFMNLGNPPPNLPLERLQSELRSIEKSNNGYASNSVSPSLVVFAARLGELIPALEPFGIDLSLSLVDTKPVVSLKKTQLFQPEPKYPKGIGVSEPLH
jgi:hypothetical protein